MKLKSLLTKLIGSCVAFTLSAGTLYAADFGSAVGFETGRKYITLEGTIEKGDAAKLYAYAYQNPDHTWVSMSSLGGDAAEGYEIGNVISNLGLNTYVPYGSACMSACYTAFLGGYEYDIDGVMGGHNAWMKEDPGIGHNELLRSGQQWGAYDMIWHLANGFAAELPYAMATYTSPNVFLGFTHEDDLLKFFVRTEENNFNPYLESHGAFEQQWLLEHTINEVNIIEFANRNLNAEHPDLFDPRK